MGSDRSPCPPTAQGLLGFPHLIPVYLRSHFLSVCLPAWHLACPRLASLLAAAAGVGGARKDPPWSHQAPRVSQVTAWLCYRSLWESSGTHGAWGNAAEPAPPTAHPTSHPTPRSPASHQQFPLGGIVEEFSRKGQRPEETFPDCRTRQCLRPGFKTRVKSRAGEMAPWEDGPAGKSVCSSSLRT